MASQPPHGELKSRPAATFVESVADVTFHGADAHHKPGSDSPIAQPFKEELDHGGFCWGEALLSHNAWRCF